MGVLCLNSIAVYSIRSIITGHTNGLTLINGVPGVTNVKSIGTYMELSIDCPMTRDEFYTWCDTMRTKGILILYPYTEYLTREVGVWDECLRKEVYIPLWKIH